MKPILIKMYKNSNYRTHPDNFKGRFRPHPYLTLSISSEPPVVSCERTVRAGGGLVKYAGMLATRDWIAVFHYANESRPPEDLGPGTGHHRGRHPA